MQDIELFVPENRHTAELGRICFEAFRQVAEAHGFERDFPDAGISTRIVDLIQSLPASFKIAARVGERVVGSNFMILTDSEAVALALIGQLPRYAPPGTGVFFCPLRNASLYRAALKAGCRLQKVMTLMARGPYEELAPVWMPSIAY
jgi:hypothetical protein